MFWSAGNESGEGKNVCVVIDEGRKYDTTRYWMYGGNAFAQRCEEIIGPRYPSPFELKNQVGMVPETVDPRPSFMDEYLSVAQNNYYPTQRALFMKTGQCMNYVPLQILQGPMFFLSIMSED